MASYGELLHSISTAAINQLLTQYGFTQWAYFVDEDDGMAGVAFASDQIFGLYKASDINKLTLTAFGIVPIGDIYYRPNDRTLNMLHKGDDPKTGEWYNIMLFTDASKLQDDEQLAPNFDNSLTPTWSQFLQERGMRTPPPKKHAPLGRTIVVVVGAIILAAILFLMFYRPS